MVVPRTSSLPQVVRLPEEVPGRGDFPGSVMADGDPRVRFREEVPNDSFCRSRELVFLGTLVHIFPKS